MTGRALLDERLRDLELDPTHATPISDEVAVLLFELVQRHRSPRTLEVGFGSGKSAVAIMTATSAPHVVIDPFQRCYGNWGVENVNRVGLGDSLELIPQMSHVALPSLLADERRFDFVFIDGGHRFDQVFVDFYYTDLLLEQFGCVVFDDLWMRTVRLVVEFVIHNRPDYEVLQTGVSRVGAIRKTGKDTRDAMSHHEFYTTRSLLSHYGNLWAAGTSHTSIRQTAGWLKRMMRR